MSVKTDSILDKDLYALFGVLQDASVKDIKTAYRKKALECHPDKNPDNPKANELFHELSRALAVLIDQSARAAYDKLLNAKLAAQKRHQVLDSKRKKFKEELDERERKAQESVYDYKKDQENFEAELERLRKLSSKQVEEELSFVRNLVKERRAAQTENNYNFGIIQDDSGVYRLKLKWPSKKSKDYDQEQLEKIFLKYGSVSAVVVSAKKKRSALIEFSSRKAAMNAFKLEKGLVSNPLTISWVGDAPQDDIPQSNMFNYNINNFPSSTVHRGQQAMNDDDFEADVLRKLKEAELNKNKQQN